MADSRDSNAAETPAAEAPGPVVSPPLAPWKVGLLVVCTFSVYTMFWLYRAASDVKAMRNGSQQPILWSLAPLIPICLVFAVPRLMREYGAYAAFRREHASWPWAWLAGFAAFAALTAMATKSHEWSVYAILAFLCVIAAAFGALQARINAVKALIPQPRYTSVPNKLRWPHWTAIGIGAPVLVVYLGINVYYDVMRAAGTALQADARYTHENEFAFDVVGDGWTTVPVGTFSDGTATLELSGKLQDLYVLVFRSSPGISLDDSAYHWQSSADDWMMGHSCTHDRTLIEATIRVRALILCRGHFLGDPVTEVMSIVESERGVYAFVAHVSAVRDVHDAWSERIVRMARSFDAP